MRVLIVKSSASSDIIHALPVLDYLKQASSGIEIDWVVEEHCQDLVAGNPQVSMLHLLRTQSWRKKPFSPSTWHEIGELKQSLRARQYQIVFDLQGTFKSGIVDWLTDAPSIIGFEEPVVQERINAWFTNRKSPLKAVDYHSTDQFLRLVSLPFGRNFHAMQLKSEIYTSFEDDQAAALLLATLGDGLVFLFHYGSPFRTNLWAENNWVILGDIACQRFPDVTILFSWGNEGERETVTALAQAIGRGARVIDRYHLKGFAALLKKVDLVVGGDTLPLHVAAAVGTPTVSLYRASDGRRCGPRGNQHVVIQAPIHCAACCRTDCDNDAACRASIPPERVLAGIEQALGKEQ